MEKETMNTLKSPIMRDRHASFERSASESYNTSLDNSL